MDDALRDLDGLTTYSYENTTVSKFKTSLSKCIHG